MKLIAANTRKKTRLSYDNSFSLYHHNPYKNRDCRLDCDKNRDNYVNCDKIAMPSLRFCLSDAEPVFDEADVFTLTIPLDDRHNPESGASSHNGIITRANHQQLRQAIMEAISSNPLSSAKSIAEQLGTDSAAQVRTQLDKMRTEGILRREGPTGHGGRWVLSGDLPL